eukprot:CAMPEP_0206483248 /NCGR_PEP_ID=MMETSP0324_2-20121206/39317_1 /ASSEMBLY_ACC=CAM_ASM_000836 /TAXON_ID=2866 /ORGANISM="Crypthecodinium cohnii, Strain Seligo" /LENGTH=63 /DNA_ID=CAMNT_0053961271 /DNA_START=34 /DNA_END=221 /DNA_ORIENTATION=+
MEGSWAVLPNGSRQFATGGCTSGDMLTKAQTNIYDDRAMAATLPADVHQRFKECLKSGAPTSP